MNTDEERNARSARVRFVLVNTSHPGNIGSAARAIRTMGFDRLGLVAPESFPHGDAYALAAGALDVLDRACISSTLQQAVADCSLVIGATARLRGVSLEEWSPREAATRVLEAAERGREVALVFGNERVGLSNDEIMLCHAAVHIPSDPGYSSLNLAQAVQVLAYELRMAQLAGVAARVGNTDAPATSIELEGFFTHLATTLDDIDFHKGRSPRTIMRRLRKLFLRAQPDQRELRVLRGILADAQRMARLAKERIDDESD
ncbi:RNA methyltransferase [Dokdonella sp.]|uniref:RNA methyltransferase n=1 Tax=Dokdonella sp. TaxID=2291710 RepID=UPI0025BEF84D|nr:RNA methyltransferase [Dokdonella sp.]MBX3692866.1 RNA methyltransferase [Dokdonella sp.]MCW5566658.1 RNA methyltransferase [Dokdonella sp.]